MENILLYENEEIKAATEKVLAAFKVKSINENIDTYIADALKYALKIDEILEANKLERRYLDIVSNISDKEYKVTLDEKLETLDFRAKEEIEDLIKRINTRLTLINADEELLKKVKDSFNIDDIDLEKEIKNAKLLEEDFE